MAEQRVAEQQERHYEPDIAKSAPVALLHEQVFKRKRIYCGRRYCNPALLAAERDQYD